MIHLIKDKSVPLIRGSVEVLIAMVFVFLLTSSLQQREAARFDAVPATEWFEVTELFVPDFEFGGDPLLAYDRDIRRPFQGFWVVEVERRDSSTDRDRFFAACAGSGTNIYDPSDYLDPTQVTWSWFLGRPCSIPPGTYRLVVTWDLRVDDDGHVKRYKVLSNVFTVWPVGQMPRR